MRKHLLTSLVSLAVLAGCTKEDPKSPVEQILELGIQAEKDIAETAAKKAATQDVSEAVELGKFETALADSARARMNAILGGKDKRLPLTLGTSTDTLPVIFGGATIGRPDFYKGQFSVNLVISGTNKRPLPEGTYFQLVALDSAGKVLASKDASMVDSLKVGDSLYAGGIFHGAEVQGLRAIAAR
jgi:hypothetical protein